MGQASRPVSFASAAEEMNAQALQMKHNVGQLVTIIDGDSKANISPATQQPVDSEKSHAAQKNVKPTVKKLLTAGTAAPKKGKAVRLEDMIPFEKDDFKDF